MPKDYDPYRTPPLWIDPKEPLDYVHDVHTDIDSGDDHECETDGLDRGPERPISEFAKPSSNFTQESSMKFTDLLIPPVNATQEQLRRWRLYISLAIISLSTVAAMQFGLVPGIPFSGFAYASDVKDIKVKLLERDIFDSLVRQCSAKDDESRQFYAQKVQGLLTEYREIAKAEYQRPSCREITGSAPMVPNQQ